MAPAISLSGILRIIITRKCIAISQLSWDNSTVCAYQLVASQFEWGSWNKNDGIWLSFPSKYWVKSLFGCSCETHKIRGIASIAEHWPQIQSATDSFSIHSGNENKPVNVNLKIKIFVSRQVFHRKRSEVGFSCSPNVLQYVSKNPLIKLNLQSRSSGQFSLIQYPLKWIAKRSVFSVPTIGFDLDRCLFQVSSPSPQKMHHPRIPQRNGVDQNQIPAAPITISWTAR